MASHKWIRSVQGLADVEDQALALRLDFDACAADLMGAPMNADLHNDTFLDCGTRYSPGGRMSNMEVEGKF